MPPIKISRRGFLKLFAGATPTLVATQAMPAAPAPPTLRKVFLAEAYIAGFRYYEGMQDNVLAALAVGDELALRRQPDNPHDPNAIAIYTLDGRKLGYVPRSENLAPAVIADQDVPLSAEIVAVTTDAQPWERVRVRVYQQIADAPASPEVLAPARTAEPARIAPATAAAPLQISPPLDLDAVVGERIRWWVQYFEEVDYGLRLCPPRGDRDACVCCGYPTLEDAICPLCLWTDDGEADCFAPTYINCGANAGYSLAEARVNFHERLTMHRPDDPRSRLDASPEALAAKRAMIAAFDRMQDTTNDAAIQGLWFTVYRNEDLLTCAFD